MKTKKLTDSKVSEDFFGSIDIGSHTTRLLIVRKEGTELVPVRTERRVTRLAQDFQVADTITEEAQQRNIAALKEYVSVLREFGVCKFTCGSTGVVRRAKYSRAVLERIAAETGIKCRVLSEETEALASSTGILSVLHETGDDLLTFDIGGGSTEFVLMGPSPTSTASRPVGAATLTEAYLRGDPPGPEAVERATLSAKNEIVLAEEQLYKNLKKNGIIPFLAGLRLVGTAGTVTTLAAMCIEMERYVPYRINGMVLNKGWLSRTIDSLAQMPLAQRRTIAGLEPGREDVILGGAIIVSEILSRFGSDSFVVSDAGLLEGLIVELIRMEWAGSGSNSSPTRNLTWRLQKG